MYWVIVYRVLPSASELAASGLARAGPSRAHMTGTPRNRKITIIEVIWISRIGLRQRQSAAATQRPVPICSTLFSSPPPE